MAFVLFNLRAEAEAAISSLNGVVPKGCHEPMRAKFATQPTIPSSSSSSVAATPQWIAVAVPTTVAPGPTHVEILPYQLPAMFDASTGLTAVIPVNRQMALLTTR